MCGGDTSSEGSETPMSYPHPKNWTPRDFYDHVRVPEKSSTDSDEIKIDLLHCRLFPFQRRAVRWLLSSEGGRGGGIRPGDGQSRIRRG